MEFVSLPQIHLTSNDVEMTGTDESKITKTLNHDCLNHIFQFLTPKEWIPFTQVSQTWKFAAYSKELQTFKYIGRTSGMFRKTDIDEKLNFTEFLEILEFVAPKLKYAKIKKYRNECENESNVLVKFGRFEFTVRVNRNEEKFFQNIFMKRTKRIEILKINSLDGATKLEWEHFFQANCLNYFNFSVEFLYCQTHHDKSLFFDYISILPSNLEQVVLVFDFKYILNYDEQQKISQFLQRLPRLSKVHLDFGSGISPLITTEISKHVNTIKELCLIQPTLDTTFGLYLIEHELKILSVIPNCTSLTKLSLHGFTLREDLCKQIAENCLSIQCLKLQDMHLTETCFRLLTSLPNLIELYIPSTYMTIKLTKEMTNLKRLIIKDARKMKGFDFENLATALVLMPTLSSLRCHPSKISLTETAACKIKQIIHSRGQNIVLYSLLYSWEEKCVVEKVGEIANAISNKEFSISIVVSSSRVKKLLKTLKKA